MSKGAKIFCSIIYYLVAFVFGLFLAIMVPYTLNYTKTMKGVYTSLHEGEYEGAIGVVGGYYNSTPYLDYKFESGGGIVLFEAATLVYNSGEEGDTTVDKKKLHKAYAGYIYGVRDTYKITSNDANASGLGIINTNNSEKRDSFIDYDSDSDEVKDTNATITLYDFMFIDLDSETYGSIKQIVMYEADGSEFARVDVTLDFSGEFFSDVDAFISEYNTNPESKSLQALNDELLAKSDNYHMSSYGLYQKQANRISITIILVYFFLVYFVGDTLLGPRFFLKGIKKILKKVFKVKFKSDELVSPEEVYGHDYFSNVTLKLDTSAADDLNTAVIIKYSNETEGAVEFDLTKSENYTQTKRIKAGTYVNPWIEMSSEFQAIDMPDNLVVKGYRMEVVVKIEKKDGNEE